MHARAGPGRARVHREKTRIGFKPELASRGFDRRGEKRLWSGIGQERSPPKRFSCARNLCFGGRAPIARPKLRVNLVPFSLSSDYYTRTKDQMSLHFRSRSLFSCCRQTASTPSHPRSAKNAEAELESGTGVFSTSPTNSSAFPARFLKPALAFVAIAPRQRSRRRARVPRRCIFDPITLAFGSGRYSSRTRAA